MVLDSTVDVQCRDIGLKTVLIFGEEQVCTLWRCPKPAIFSKSCTELVPAETDLSFRYVELVPVENDSSARCAELVLCSPLRRFLTAFSAGVDRWGKTTRMRYGIRTGPHSVIHLNDQSSPHKAEQCLDAREAAECPG